MKKFLAATAFGALATTLSAGGIGLYVPYSIGQTYDASYSDSPDVSGTLKNKTGLGFIYDSNPNGRGIYNYRFLFEYTNPIDKNVNDEFSSNNYTMMHTFGFGIVRTKVVRLWVGPRINIGYESYDKNGYSKSGIEVGIAPAIGINFNIASILSFSLDVDYKFDKQFGAYSYNTILGDASGTYSESRNGITARATAMLIF